ncbi:hypothetical protein ONV78_17940 [Hahella sp. CR1]|uniref:hypothetical protein n=1 Tax=Hahella sp. CR1 TaxID=2992807 RepID=UPI002441A901|nr:hypothetical protein [Hahella sp. CR1]MDG9669623.1 hypothetical protein [Hahella sp. CR1]
MSSQTSAEFRTDIYKDRNADEMEGSIKGLHRMGLQLIDTNNNLHRILDFIENSLDVDDPLEIFFSVQRVLTFYDFEYIFKVNTHRFTYISGTDLYVPFQKLDLINTISGMGQRVVYSHDHWAVVYPHFSICAKIDFSERDKYTDPLIRLARAVNLVLARLTQKKPECSTILQHNYATIDHTLELLNDTVAIESSRTVCSELLVSELRWSVSETCKYDETLTEREQKLIGVINKLLYDFEEQQASHRLIESYLRSIKTGLRGLTTESRQAI